MFNDSGNMPYLEMQNIKSSRGDFIKYKISRLSNTSKPQENFIYANIQEFLNSAGYGARELSKDLAERMAIKYHEAERLVQTEISHISNQATIDSYKEMGIEYYKILAEIDSKTSEICADMNGKTFKLSEAVPGITVPPFHPNCRSTTVAYFPEVENNVEFNSDMNGSVSDMVQDILNGGDIEKTFTEWAKNNADEDYVAQVAGNSEKYKDFDENILRFSNNSGIIDTVARHTGKSSGIIGDSDGMTTITDIKPINFNDKAAISKEIDYFAKKYAYANVEYALEISPNGNAYNLIGTKYNVNSEIIGKEALKGGISIHNHTIFAGLNKGDCFSLDDLSFAIRNNTGKQYLVSGERRNIFEFTKIYKEEDIIEAWDSSQKKIWQKHLENGTQPIFIYEEILQDLKLCLEGFEFYENF